MKPHHLLLCVVLLQVSCKEEKPVADALEALARQEETMRKAERRIRQLEQDLQVSQDLQSRLSEKLHEYQAAEAGPVAVAPDVPMETVETTVAAPEIPIGSYRARSPGPSPALAALDAQKNPLRGLQPQVVKTILQKAQLDWPNNERMQQRQIECQAEAWEKMEEYRLKSYGAVPFQIKNGIVYSAQREWPLNYQMQVAFFEDQINSFEMLETWRRTGAPGLKIAETNSALQVARSRWPGDYRMQIATITRFMDGKIR